MTNEDRLIVDPKNVAIRLECKKCGYESVVRMGIKRLVSACPSCGEEWGEHQSNSSTTFREFVHAIRTLWNVDGEDGATYTVRLEIPIERKTASGSEALPSNEAS